jgi:SAM-dependent methyltransferase
MQQYQRMARLGYTAARTLIPGGRRKYEGRGYCPSCDNSTIFVLAKGHAQWIRGLASEWENSDAFKASLAVRESHVCGICGANYRMRVQARTLLRLLGMHRTRALFEKLSTQPEFSIYETATHNVFRNADMLALKNYVSSEYFNQAKPGEFVNGVMNQTLEGLTFADESFDVVLTSEVLEHVVDLDRALAEIRRVLKPGGLHVFTVPNDPQLLHSAERARFVQGKIVHMKPPVFHGDSLREEGILAFRDFGSNATAYLSRPGLICEEIPCRESDELVSSVFVARKVE